MLFYNQKFCPILLKFVPQLIDKRKNWKFIVTYLVVNFETLTFTPKQKPRRYIFIDILFISVCKIAWQCLFLHFLSFLFVFYKSSVKQQNKSSKNLRWTSSLFSSNFKNFLKLSVEISKNIFFAKRRWICVWEFRETNRSNWRKPA